MFKKKFFNFKNFDLKNRKNILELIDESKMFDNLKLGDSKQYVEEVSLAVRRLEFINSKKSENLINIFRLNSGEGDFELAILRAFLNCRKTLFYI